MFRLIILLLFLNCSESNSSITPLALFLRNLTIQRLKPITSYGFTKTRYLTYLESEINYIPTTNGTPPFTYSIEPNLPKGLTLNSSTGAIQGVVDKEEPVAETTYRIRIKNSWGESTTSIKISILNPDSFTDKRNSQCYDNATVTSCGNTSFPNQDFEFKGKTQSNVFVASETLDGFPSDYFTFDKVRGQYWSCPNLRTGNDCSRIGIVNANKDTAIKSCNDMNLQNSGNGYAGRKDWRLPEIQELFTLINYEPPFIDPIFFPLEGITCSEYWSNTKVSSDLTKSYKVSTNFYIPERATETDQICFRCISGKSNTKSDLVDNNNYTITDRRTKLVWQKCYNNLNLDSTCSGSTVSLNWTNALQYCKNLTLANRTWRLPSLNELFTLYDFQKTILPFHDPLFGNFSLSRNINTSTTNAIVNNQRYSINFTSTGIDFYTFDKNFFTGPVRCVSDL